MKQQMKTQFDYYLLKKRYSERTRKNILYTVLQFEQWATSTGIEQLPTTVYADLLLYIKHCTAAGNTRKTIALKLLFLRHFFNFLLERKIIASNPVTGIKIQGIKRGKLYSLLTREELDKLYNDYPANAHREKLYKVIVGLLLYQGLRSKEIVALQVDSLYLRARKLLIKSSSRANERTLLLQPQQIVEIMEYLQDTRKYILKKSRKTSNQFIVSMEGNENLHNTFRLFNKGLRTIKGISCSKQVRRSVICHWLKQHNLREVQYMAGHRYVSSTERYKQNNLDGLIEDISKYHPLI